MGRWANKYVIGLTGNIAMGKSLVRKMLENLGAYTIDADGLAHQAMAPGAPTYGPIVEYFGKWILDGEKKIDRARLGAVVFSHNAALNLLEKLTHPVVGQAIDILVSRAKQPIVVVEAIKLVDGVLGGQVDAIWVVDATPEVQLQRLIEKRSNSEYEARKRIETQNPQADKISRADVIIYNNGSPEDVYMQVQREWQKTMTALRPTTNAIPVVAQPRPAQPAPMPAGKPPTGPLAPPATPPPTSASIKPPTGPLVPPPAPLAKPPTGPLGQPAVKKPQTGSLLATYAPHSSASTVEVRRGTPKNADAIARLLVQASGKQIGRMDVILAFGEKSYLLAEIGGRMIGIAGFQVENLITRMDEFFIVPDVPLAAVAPQLITAVEEASKELQSEVGFMFIPRTAPPNLLGAFFGLGYERIEIDSLKVPAWREAAQELQSSEKQILMKKLRAERVLKPV